MQVCIPVHRGSTFVVRMIHSNANAYLISGATFTLTLILAIPQKLFYGKTELEGMKLSPLLLEGCCNLIHESQNLYQSYSHT